MNENEFWLGVWKLVTVAIMVLTLSISSCSIVKHRTVAELVKNGANPIDAYCAINTGDSSGDPVICTLRALEKVN